MFREFFIVAVAAMYTVSLSSVEGGSCVPKGCITKCVTADQCKSLNQNFIPNTALCTCCGLCMRYLPKGAACVNRFLPLPRPDGSDYQYRELCDPKLSCGNKGCQ